MNPFSFFPFFSFLINIVLASIVLGLNFNSKTNRAYAAFACNFAFWEFLHFLVWNIHSPQNLKLFAYIEPFAWLPTTFLVLNFIYVLVKRPPDLPFKIMGITVIGWLFFAAFTGSLIKCYKSAYWGEFAILNDIYYPAVVMTSIIPACWGFYILCKSIRTARDESLKVHLKYLTVGTAVMYFFVISDSVLKAALFKIDSFPSTSSFFLIIQSGFVFIAIIRHRFLNIDLRDIAHEIFYRVNECVIILNVDQSVCTMNASTINFFGENAHEKMNITPLFGDSYRFDDTINNLEITFSNNGGNKTGLLSQSNLYSQNILIGKLVIIRDITLSRADERKRIMLENQVQQMNASHLEALGKLAGGIAHDFNNILSVISGSATLLRMILQKKDPALLSHAESIIKTSRDASVLTKKMLTFACQNFSEITAVDCHEVINDVVSMLRHSIDKSIIITIDLIAENYNITGDQIQLQNMFLNIAINACDAMPGGGILHFASRNELPGIDLIKSCNFEAPEGAYIVIDVQDNGTGMTNEIKRNIFEPFFTTKQRGKGTGLGLATAYGTSQGHKGFITVDSEYGKGTVFHIYLPVIDEKSIEIDKEISEVNYGSGRILIVDDEEKIRCSTAEMLRNIGYTTMTSCNGEEAVRIYAENSNVVDLVLLDVIMPVMNGIVCAEELKKINPDVKIIFISGFPGNLSSESINSLPLANSAKFICKPFAIEQLSRAIKEVIEK
jgi:signal transduction histidine kinase/CheY-like chemotaxis protein